MGAKEIIEKKFELVLRGYKTEDVEEFLRQVSLDFLRMQKENEDLEKKLEVLADKIREYREDEDTLKDALLGAQRQGNALIADSKRKAAEVIEEAQSTSDSILKKAEEDRQKLKEKGESEIEAAKEEARTIIDNANANASEIERQMNLKTDVQKEILHRTSTEVAEFKQRIVGAYKEQIGSIEKIAQECENEFIKNALKEKRPDFKSQENGIQNNSQDFSNQKGKNRKNKGQRNDGKSNTSSIKFEVDISDDNVGDTRDDIVVESNIEADVDAIFGNKNDGNRGGNSDIKDTSDIFFKKNPDGKTKDKLRFGGGNNNN